MFWAQRRFSSTTCSARNIEPVPETGISFPQGYRMCSLVWELNLDPNAAIALAGYATHKAQTKCPLPTDFCIWAVSDLQKGDSDYLYPRWWCGYNTLMARRCVLSTTTMSPAYKPHLLLTMPRF